ncbi:hypothetical protein LQZ19_05475 [Treponema primitia]|uniref:hypothetical protein n=1 Tax=Treponema primitia TaxID=88058 RepID=UPI0012FE419B|nr:hypothetical protein [Treponema primitia]
MEIVAVITVAAVVLLGNQIWKMTHYPTGRRSFKGLLILIAIVIVGFAMVVGK